MRGEEGGGGARWRCSESLCLSGVSLQGHESCLVLTEPASQPRAGPRVARW